MSMNRQVDRTLEDVAERTHSAAIHLLRWIREVDGETGLSPSRLSALSVVVFAGPLTLGELAAAERVTPPTITRLVDGLESAGLVRRDPHPEDRRAVRIRATAKGRALLLKGRSRRVDRLVARMRSLDTTEIQAMRTAAEVIERIVTDTAGPN
jgi:DNA-binding MarR family transcriptional regulator